jgi:hypothetical protein
LGDLTLERALVEKDYNVAADLLAQGKGNSSEDTFEDS